MSEEQTKDVSKKYDTKPTIETVLERITVLDTGLNARITELEDRLNERAEASEHRLNDRFNSFENIVNNRLEKFEDRIDIRLDRIECEVKKTHSELFDLRADFKEWRGALRDHLPIS